MQQMVARCRGRPRSAIGVDALRQTNQLRGSPGPPRWFFLGCETENDPNERLNDSCWRWRHISAGITSVLLSSDCRRNSPSLPMFNSGPFRCRRTVILWPLRKREKLDGVVR